MSTQEMILWFGHGYGCVFGSAVSISFSDLVGGPLSSLQINPLGTEIGVCLPPRVSFC